MNYFVYQNKRYLLVRYIYYQLNKDGSYSMKESNKNYVGLFVLDENDNYPRLVGFCRERVPILQEQPTFSQGLEDVRAIVHKDNVYVTGNSLTSSARKDLNDVFLASLNIDSNPPTIHSLVPLVSPDSSRIEKNWIPFISEGKICGIYSLHPLIICDMTSNKSFVRLPFPNHTYEPRWHDILKRLRGSSNLQPWQDKYICVFHTGEKTEDIYCYVHYMLILDKSLRVLEITEPFTFEKASVEYCMGINLVDPSAMRDDLSINFWYTVMDRNNTKKTVQINSVVWNKVK